MIQSNEIIEVLWRRQDFISLMQGHTPTSREELTEKADLSKPAIYKKLNQLEEHDVIRETHEDGERSYEFTTFEGVALEKYRQLEKVCDFSQPLSNPAVEEKIPKDVVSESEFYPSERYAPHKPLEEIEKFLNENDGVKSFATTILPQYVEMYYDSIMDGTEIELVFQKDVLENLEEDYADYLYDALDSGNLNAWVTDESLPFGLITSSNGMKIIKYNNGNLVGVISNDRDTLTEWADGLFEKYKKEGSAVKGLARVH